MMLCLPSHHPSPFSNEKLYRIRKLSMFAKDLPRALRRGFTTPEDLRYALSLIEGVSGFDFLPPRAQVEAVISSFEAEAAVEGVLNAGR